MKVSFEYITSPKSLAKWHGSFKDIPFLYIDTETVGDST